MQGPMCVVCGKVETKGQMRRSGFKCATCIGKASKEALRPRPRHADYAGWLEVAPSGQKRKRRWVHAHPDGVAWFEDVQLRRDEVVTARDTALLRSPRQGSSVVLEAPAGCVLLLRGEERDGWCKASQQLALDSPVSPRPLQGGPASPGEGFAEAAEADRIALTGWLQRDAVRQPPPADRSEGLIPWIASATNSRGGVTGQRTCVKHATEPPKGAASGVAYFELSYFEPEKGDKASGKWQTVSFGADSEEARQGWMEYMGRHAKDDSRPLGAAPGEAPPSPGGRGRPGSAESPRRRAARASPQGSPKGDSAAGAAADAAAA
eukprot:TRINITY_DN47007_c0_g1_i1.p1 TRINITY_DN47007_c0_g1~~TRINITY_DN47007_c0_g1_i1.p1  ORF type:complete len:351 (+),score=98.64 TRINITY_DN47007_c0_g1_i1:92-1054(+)